MNAVQLETGHRNILLALTHSFKIHVTFIYCSFCIIEDNIVHHAPPLQVQQRPPSTCTTDIFKEVIDKNQLIISVIVKT